MNTNELRGFIFMSHHQNQEQTLTETTARPTECLDDVSNFKRVLMQEMFKI